MAAIDDKVDNLTKVVEALRSELSELSKKVAGDKGLDKELKKGSDSDLAYASALLPLFGMTTWGFGNPLLLPFGLRLAAARALVLHRALERAAKITGELAKSRDDTAETPDLVDQFFSGILSRKQEDREAVAKFVRSVWRDK